MLTNRDCVIVFDFDGTLVDTAHHFVNIANILAKKYKFKPIFEKDFDLLRSLTVREIIKTHCQIPWYKIPFILIEFRRLLAQSASQTQLFPEIDSILQELKNRGFRLGIITSSPSNTVDLVLTQSKIKNYFEFVKTDSPLFHKEKDMLKMMKKFGFEPKNMIYLGDEIRDFKACQKINVKCLSVTWGFSSIDLLQKYNPDNILTKPHRILEYFK